MITIHIASKHGPQFPKCIKSIIDSATSNDFEIIVKVDSDQAAKNRESILEKFNIPFTVINNRVTGYENLHVMKNQMAKKAKGDLLFGLGDDCYVSGDWYGAFKRIQKQNPDNIFIINTRVNKSWAVCPVVSRGWYEALGYLAVSPSNDYFLKTTGDRCSRYLSLPPDCDVKIAHDRLVKQCLPKKVRQSAMRKAESASRGASKIIIRAIKNFYDQNPQLR